MFTFIRAFPMTFAPILIYALFALPSGYEGMRNAMTTPMFSIHLPSGADWVGSRGDVLLMFGAVCLFIEIVKSTSTTRAALIENGLAFACFVVAIVAFLLVSAFGTMVFFLLSGMLMIDFLAGFVVMTISARRDVSFSPQ
jgi:hypothetical protein